MPTGGPGAPPHLPRTGPLPPARVLANGRYAVLLTAAGTGASRIEGRALTAWAGDRLEDADGLFLFVRDRESGEAWSLGCPAAPGPDERAEAGGEPGRFRLRRTRQGIEASLEVAVVPDADAEIRRVRLVNRSGRSRSLEIVTLAEAVLLDPAAHAAHPVFSKLFLQTAFAPSHRALLVHRRPRGAGETHPWMVHALLDGAVDGFETDRERFPGRERRPADPVALPGRWTHEGTAGNVLDAVVSLRTTTDLAPDASVERTFVLGVGEDRAAALALVERLAAPGAVGAALDAAGAHETALRRRLGMTDAEAEVAQSIVGAMGYGDPRLRAADSVLDRARPVPAELAALGVAARRPLVVLPADRVTDESILPALLRMHAYAVALALPFDLFVLGAGPDAGAGGAAGTARAGELPGVRFLDPAQLPGGSRDALEAAAHWVVTGLPPVQPAGEAPAEETTGAHADGAWPAAGAAAAGDVPSAFDPAESLALANGFGGFAPEGHEYVIRLAAEPGGGLRRPPRPWINVIANERFGLLVSETGAATTWSDNSRERRLTPWTNDPLLDPHAEALYVRDEETGESWSPLPGPRPGAGDYETRHGIGWSSFRTRCGGLDQETVLFVPSVDPVRVARVRLTNRTDRARRLSVLSYARLVIGDDPQGSGRLVRTRLDPATGALLARGARRDAHDAAIAFGRAIATDAVIHGTGDRESFLGRRRDTGRPEALDRRSPLDGRAGTGPDACFAHQVVLTVGPRQTVDVGFLLGEARDETELRALLERLATTEALDCALAETRAAWERFVSAVRIETPSPALDRLVNAWLPYQNLSCRILGRSALYQSGGAFGFRDQLQDAAALMPLAPERTRAQILRHAGSQFEEGDVLHWWHPPGLRGIRTRFADDLLWLPYLTADYVRTTGDRTVLDESIPYLVAPALAPGEDEVFVEPAVGADRGDVYAHCCRALDRALATGAHGLPLFGTGDWNDGMNRVGREGRGESVWMGFFLFAILGDFLPLCEARGDRERVARYGAHREALRGALEEAGWDGAWYRRGYYDDGTPLGTRDADECRIDALAQAWAVLSGAAPPERAAQAMDSVERHLVSEDEGLIRLLTPPFESTPHDPGYIKGYVRGVRENGGQYTHAALWVVRAMARLRRNDRVAPLLDVLDPVRLAGDPDRVATYRVEPYVIAADVYGAPPHVGRGGWTWYTGSAGWMYRVALEDLLGVRMRDGRELVVDPCIPDAWPGFSVALRLPGDGTRYEIRVRNPGGRAGTVTRAALDGTPVPVEDGRARIPLVRDGELHRVAIELGIGAGIAAATRAAGDD